MPEKKYDVAKRPGRARQPAAIPVVPESLVWTVRIGGLMATAFAAAISAQTLYRLGRLLDLAPATAWLLPGALDLCAGVCIWTAAALPAGHPGRQKAAIYATLALTMTICCNALYHAITLGQWTWQDDSLMAVSALPPLVVEILLHLQTIVTNGHATPATANEAASTVTVSAPPATANPIANRQPAAPLATANPAPQIANAPTANTPGANANPPATANPQTVNAKPPSAANANTRRFTDPEWTAIAKPVYATEVARLGKRPPEQAWLAALIAELERLTTAGQIPAAADPSLGTAKRVRDLVEAEFPELQPTIHLVKAAS